MSHLDVAVDGHLGRLLDEVAEAAELLAAHGDRDRAAVDDARDRAAVATLQLDGSPLTEVPGPVPPPPAGTATGPARGGWLEVLRAGAVDLDRAPDEVVLAIEHRGARAGLDADDLAGGLRDDLVVTLAALHTRVTDGLLAPETAGQPRRSDQAVHDASIGRILFFPVDRDHVPARMAELATWLADGDAVPVVAAGVLQHQLLDIHPYEAANGRLGRIAARLLLATAGIDAQRIAVPEAVLSADPIGYLDDVARSRRLGSPAVFVTRWAEALAAALWDVVDEQVEVPAATVAFLGERPGATFTIADHRDATTDGDEALVLALRAGLAERALGTRGLRWRATG